MNLVLTLAILACTASANDLLFVNNCPDELALYSNLQAEALGTIPTGNVFRMNFIPGADLTFWTNLNGGQANGENALRLLIGMEDRQDDSKIGILYYLPGKPANERLGVGLSFKAIPRTPPGKKDCVNITCNSFECDLPSGKQKKGKGRGKDPFNLIELIRLASLIHTCGVNAVYITTFCPDRKYPTEFSSNRIRTSNARSKCLDVQDSDLKEGSALVVKDCNDSKTQQWVLDGGRTRIRVANSKMCLERDADGDGVRLKPCTQRQELQRWILDSMGRIGTGVVDVQLDKCLDVTNGVKIATCKTRDEHAQIFSV